MHKTHNLMPSRRDVELSGWGVSVLSLEVVLAVSIYDLRLLTETFINFSMQTPPINKRC